MNMKKTVKKIVALGAGAGLVSMTLASAFAVAPDLADYPSFVIEDGQFDGKIVVGADASTSDVLGAIDIAASLQAASTTRRAVSEGTTTTTLEGDAAQIGESSDLLEGGEFIGDVVNTLTEDDLAMLQGGRVTTSKGSTAFTQTLELDATATGNHKAVVLAEDNDDVTAPFLFFDDGQELFTYELEFTSGLESDVDSNSAEDLEDESIFMLGQYYSIVAATVDNSGDDLTLELIAGDVVDTLTEGQAKTYTVDGTDYEVTVLVIGSGNSNANTVKFLVNGETTDSLNEGDTDTLSDGLEIGVREIIETTAYRESDAGSVVEFYLGANKIEFDVPSSGTAGSVEINRENIEDASVVITYTDTVSGGNGDIRISNIQYSLNSDADSGTDIYVPAGEGLREMLDEPEGMLNAEWDFVFAGLSEPSTSTIEFAANGDDEYELRFENRRGDEFSVPFLYTDGTNVKTGDEDDDFLFYERVDEAADNSTRVDLDAAMFHIGDSDYFVLSDDAGSNQGDSYVMQFEDFDTDDNTLSFNNVATGDTLEVVYSGVTSLDNATWGYLAAPATNAEITVGGQNFGVWIYNNSGVYELAIDMDGDGDLADYFGGSDFADGAVNVSLWQPVPLTVNGGGWITLGANRTGANFDFPDSAELIANGIEVWLTTADEDIDSDSADLVNRIDFTVSGSSPSRELDLSLSNTYSPSADFYFSGRQSLDGEDVDVAWNQYGTFFEVTDETDEADSIVISYPSEQVEALVYVVGGDVQATETTTGGNTYDDVNPLDVGLAVLDTDITDADATNHIVVGGPCANVIAADLLGNPSDCSEGFEPGMAMIRTFDTGDNVAILVAGFSARDTVEASQILAQAAQGDVDGLEGDNVEVVIAGANDVTVRAAMVEEEEEMDE